MSNKQNSHMTIMFGTNGTGPIVIDWNSISGYESLVRPCDDPHLNFLRIRNNALWEELYSKRRYAAYLKANSGLTLAC